MKKPKNASASRYSKGWETRRRNAKARQRQRDAEINPNPPPTGFTVTDYRNAPTPSRMAAQQAVALRDGEQAPVNTAPGRGEIVGGRESSLVEEIARVIRKKGGKDTVQAMITQQIQLAHLEGANDTEARLRRLMKNQREHQNKKIVCGFLAEVRVAEQLHSNTGLPNALVFNIPAVTLVKIVDVLRKAGYSHDGYHDPKGDGEQRAIGHRHDF